MTNDQSDREDTSTLKARTTTTTPEPPILAHLAALAPVVAGVLNRPPSLFTPAGDRSTGRAIVLGECRQPPVSR
ncbi:MAG TPA: hypothetical protein PKK74_03710 [Candidatus Methanoculleus thermohydrogenotrophicum]|nr:hypothetical protein [Candidatus Methanoculleus thermohydrogenotrophicum]HOB17784.1 hypothetical protein [Candidatus Methanoculleus thermohydrogenotrophicum]HPZ37967.1 hypothetical protein [Candidatus Methanoculleus thermohydrogenotrophicum]